MPHPDEHAVTQVLGGAIESLDIPDELFLAAVTEYGLVGDWLANHADGETGWEVYPQGSFRLGTVVQPLGRDEYDIDLVCRRGLDKSHVSQEELKDGVGAALDSYIESRRDDSGAPDSCENRKRCFTLTYDRSFHLDVLPAIDDDDHPPTGILLTDRDLRRWQHSNPKAYAEWFRARMREEFMTKRASLAEAAHVEPEEVPESRVKTTLQRTVQALKHHRNIYFAEDLEARPSSILLSTLAAHTYTGERDLYDALITAARGMPDHIEGRPSDWAVPNPVQPRENFADKWNDYPERATKFRGWLDQLVGDLEGAEQEGQLERVAVRLSESFGHGPIDRGVEKLESSASSTTRRVGPPARRAQPELAPGEKDLERDFNIPIQISETVSIKGEVLSKPGFRSHLINSHTPIEKRRDLRFSIAHTSVPPPFDVYWKVKNYGTEAEAADSLRGEITLGRGGCSSVKSESTLYTGSHYVEVYLVRDAICVAQARQEVSIY
jgi:Adenylyl/Guanylyl and SMODS C-terminal sensor domain/Second Messenger Oligonucleotide or Dinucleotide Synthetase domain